MTDYSITSAQVHFRGVPSNGYNPTTPGSIIEHLSTSMKVTMTSCFEVPQTGECHFDYFNAQGQIINTIRKRFFLLGKSEFGSEMRIGIADHVKLLVPRSATEAGRLQWNIKTSVWPMVFICDECGLIYKPNYKDVIDIEKTGEFKECDTPGCTGSLRQTPHILQCKVCGSIRHLPTSCKSCQEQLYLLKGNETDLETWRLECKNGHVFDFKDYSEYYCDGEDQIIAQTKHREITENRRAVRELKTTVGRGIFSPLVEIFPIGDNELQISDEELLLIALNSHQLDLFKYNKIIVAREHYRESGILFRRVKDEMEILSGRKCSPEEITIEILRRPADGSTPHPTVGELDEMKSLCNRTIKGYDFRAIDQDRLRRRCEDWVTLISGEPDNNSGPCDLYELVKKKPEIKAAVDSARASLKIKQVRYIQKVGIVTGTYGAVRGSIRPIYAGKPLDAVKVPLDGIAYGINNQNKFLEARNNSREFPVIVTKRETEGIAFILEAKRMLELVSNIKPAIWNELTSDQHKDPREYSESEASAWLAYASYDNKFGAEISSMLRMVVHTFSHALIHRFSQASGLRDSDIGELIYPELCGFVIYYGLEIPLGMLKRVFEDNLSTLLDGEIIRAMEDCDMDPTCSQQPDAAACHACLHVPDHVCEDFNSNLNRFALVGKNGIEGYWK